MTVEIIILRPGDEPVLSRIAAGVFDDPIVPQAAREFLTDPRHHLAVATEAGLVVGFASGVHYVHPDSPRPEFWINEVGVAPAQQGRGLGKALVQALLNVARDLDCLEAWVLTERDNAPALQLYKSVGGDADHGETIMFTFRL
jgi:ribosomal protein S18 acetylase RimI-like enzyme